MFVKSAVTMKYVYVCGLPISINNLYSHYYRTFCLILYF